jgi:hypothetical protein
MLQGKKKVKKEKIKEEKHKNEREEYICPERKESQIVHDRYIPSRKHNQERVNRFELKSRMSDRKTEDQHKVLDSLLIHKDTIVNLEESAGQRQQDYHSYLLKTLIDHKHSCLI